LGFEAGQTTNSSSFTGSNNTFLGYSANQGTNDTLTNATAIGANAQVTANNALVLGSISGTNGATASTNVGIGTTAPAYTLDVRGTGNFTGLVNFASGQTFPGTITGVTAGTDLTGGGASGAVTLNVDTTKVPTLAGSNTFTANQLIAGSGGTYTYMGDMGCGGTVAGLSFLSPSSCTNYALLGTGTGTMINRPTGGALHFREGNGTDQITLASGGALSVAGTATFGGLVTFASGQTFPGTGTITGVTAGTDLTGGGTSGSVTLNVDTTKVVTGVTAGTDLTGGGTGGSLTLNVDTAKIPTLAAANSFTNSNTFTSSGNGVWGQSSSANGVVGETTSSSKTNAGVWGEDDISDGIGVFGACTTGTACYAVEGNGYSGTGVYGVGAYNGGSFSSSGGNGVYGTTSTGDYAIWGLNSNPLGTGVYGVAVEHSTTGEYLPDNAPVGVWGDTNQPNAVGIAGTADNGWAGMFENHSDTYVTLAAVNDSVAAGTVFSAEGDGGTGSNYGNCSISTAGKLTCSGGEVTSGLTGLQIDHPLDPANKYLNHSSVQSSEMMNLYTGNVTTDAQGEAVVQLPDWFEAMNTDFRYQLTVIGQFAQAIVAREIANHQFSIKTDKPDVKVSWQVTGVRRDAWAKANPMPAEVEKPVKDRGHYLHPDLYGAPDELQIGPLPRRTRAPQGTAPAANPPVLRAPLTALRTPPDKAAAAQKLPVHPSAPAKQ
jgi:hypothetical protein